METRYYNGIVMTAYLNEQNMYHGPVVSLNRVIINCTLKHFLYSLVKHGQNFLEYTDIIFYVKYTE